MAEVDPDDDSIQSFAVWHYRYDSERHEGRNVVVAAFDNSAEFEGRIDELTESLQSRRGSDDALIPWNAFAV